jgi:hypothetical protein
MKTNYDYNKTRSGKTGHPPGIGISIFRKKYLYVCAGFFPTSSARWFFKENPTTPSGKPGSTSAGRSALLGFTAVFYI